MDDDDLSRVLKAAGDTTRRRILTLLVQEGALRVTALAAHFDMSLNSVSKHIKVLEEAGLVTRKTAGREEVILGGQLRWVTVGHLSAEKPVAAAAGLSMAPCPDPGVESGLTTNAVYVYRSVCNAFPQITSYGGWDGHGEHSSGRALDIMTSDVGLGTAIADFLREHAVELKLYDVLWRQRIWTQERGGEGWRAMSSRGSATANHYDHVHVATY